MRKREKSNQQQNSKPAPAKHPEPKKEDPKKNPFGKSEQIGLGNSGVDLDGNDDAALGFRVELKRKGSQSSRDQLMRKLSDADARIPRKMSKKLPEMFDELIYGNEEYPPIEYHMYARLKQPRRRHPRARKPRERGGLRPRRLGQEHFPGPPDDPDGRCGQTEPAKVAPVQRQAPAPHRKAEQKVEHGVHLDIRRARR